MNKLQPPPQLNKIINDFKFSSFDTFMRELHLRLTTIEDIGNLEATATLAQVITKFNNLLQALRNNGLIVK